MLKDMCLIVEGLTRELGTKESHRETSSSNYLRRLIRVSQLALFLYNFLTYFKIKKMRILYPFNVNLRLMITIAK